MGTGRLLWIITAIRMRSPRSLLALSPWGLCPLPSKQPQRSAKPLALPGGSAEGRWNFGQRTVRGGTETNRPRPPRWAVPQGNQHQRVVQTRCVRGARLQGDFGCSRQIPVSPTVAPICFWYRSFRINAKVDPIHLRGALRRPRLGHTPSKQVRGTPTYCTCRRRVDLSCFSCLLEIYTARAAALRSFCWVVNRPVLYTLLSRRWLSRRYQAKSAKTFFYFELK
jgi:hypothetical protein